MLTLFPGLLFLAPFSALLIRVSLGILFASHAWRHVKHADAFPRAFALVEIVIAVGLIAGAWTQVLALLGALAILAHVFIRPLRADARSTLLLGLVMCLSLVVTGAGLFAFDLPL